MIDRELEELVKEHKLLVENLGVKLSKSKKSKLQVISVIVIFSVVAAFLIIKGEFTQYSTLLSAPFIIAGIWMIFIENNLSGDLKEADVAFNKIKEFMKRKTLTKEEKAYLKSYFKALNKFGYKGV